MMTTTLPKATAAEVSFVRGIASPMEVLGVIRRGHELMADAHDPFTRVLALSKIELELIELEGEAIAAKIVSTVWPDDADVVEVDQVAA